MTKKITDREHKYMQVIDKTQADIAGTDSPKTRAELRVKLKQEIRNIFDGTAAPIETLTKKELEALASAYLERNAPLWNRVGKLIHRALEVK